MPQAVPVDLDLSNKDSVQKEVPRPSANSSGLGNRIKLNVLDNVPFYNLPPFPVAHEKITW